jgi:hypothetical protein
MDSKKNSLHERFLIPFHGRHFKSTNAKGMINILPLPIHVDQDWRIQLLALTLAAFASKLIESRLPDDF